MAIPKSAAEAVDLLGVAPGADAAAVRKRYRELAMRFHPDRNPDDPLADQRMAELNRAHDLLADGVPLDVRRMPEPSAAPPQEPQRRPQTRAERAETHQAFREEMERARRTDTERRRRQQAARRKEWREAEARARRAAEDSRRAAKPPPQTRPAEPRGARRGQTGRGERADSAGARPRRPKRQREAPSAASPPLEHVCEAIAARGWQDAANAIRARYRGNGAVAPASEEFVLTVSLNGVQYDAAVVVAAPGVALAAPLLDHAMQQADAAGVPFAFAMNERMYRQANLRKRTRTNPITLAKFPTPDELRDALAAHLADVESTEADSERAARARRRA